MRAKRILAVFLCGGLALCAGCVREPEQQNTALTIYAEAELAHDLAVYTGVLDHYRQAHPGLEVTFFETAGDETMDEAAGLAALRAVLAGGSGPDILIGQCAAQDVEKLAGAGLFYDLDRLMAQDVDFSLEQGYQQAVLEAGVMGGERLLLPLLYMVNYLASTNEILAQSGFESLETYTCADFCRLAGAFLNSRPDMALFVEDGQNYRVLVSSVYPVLDEETLESGGFRQLMEILRANMERQQALGLDPQDLDRPYFSLESGRFLFYPCCGNAAVKRLGSFAGLGNAAFFQLCGPDGGLCGSVLVYAAVSAGSQNRQNAWELARLLLTDYQDPGRYEPELKRTVTMYGEEGASVLLAGNQAVVERLQNGQIPALNYLNPDKTITTLPMGPVSDAAAAAYAAAPGRVSRVGYPYPFERTIACFDPYIAGEKAFEACLEEALSYARIHAEE